MNDAFYIAATGMQAQQKNLNTISNNLTNVNTSGFKKSRVVFSDLMIDSSKKTTSNELDALDTQNQSGSGVSASNTLRSFEAGDLKTTGSPFDIAIQGNGLIEVAMSDGTTAYTRGGTLKVNEDGKLATFSGYVLKSNLQIPENTKSISIDKDGKVSVQTATSIKPFELGYIEIARFPNQNALISSGDNLYKQTPMAGLPVFSRAGEDGSGSIMQGALESSNVNLTDEMVSLMIAQRAYEASVKAIQAADEAQSMINNLRR